MKLKRYKSLMPPVRERCAQSAESDNQNRFIDWTIRFAANCKAFRNALTEIEKPRCSVKSIRKFTRVLKENTGFFDDYDRNGWTNTEREQMDEQLETFREVRNRGVDRLEHLIATSE